MGRGRSFSRAFTLAAVRHVVIDGQRPAPVCREHAIAEGRLLRWRREDAERGEAAFGPPDTTSPVVLERKVVREFPGSGDRRVTKALQRDGWMGNHTRGRRVMRQDSLLGQLRRRVMVTTDAAPGLRTDPHLFAEPDRTGSSVGR